MTGVGVLLCFRGGCGLERCQSTSRMASVAVMLNLRADALTAACSGYQRGRTHDWYQSSLRLGRTPGHLVIRGRPLELL